MTELDTNISEIKGIGKILAKRFQLLEINTVQDLLFHFPFRYDDFSALSKIKDLKPYTNARIIGQIELIQNKRSPRKRLNITEALISDETETIKVIWFNQPFLTRNLKAGDNISLAGKVEEDISGLIMKSPEYEKVSLNNVHTSGLVPNYHSTANLTQKQIRFYIKKVIGLAKQMPEWLPAEVLKETKLLNLSESLYKIHFPKNKQEADRAKERLAFNELFLLQLKSQIIKQEFKNNKAVPVKFLEKETKNFVEKLNFKLTDSQKKSAWEILQNMQKDTPMSRLLEGDVGSGKTVVAIMAMLNIALNKNIKGQSVLMVPTEILAKQHYDSITQLLKPFHINIGLISRSQKVLNTEKNDKKLTAQDIIDNSQIIIGTHALIQEKINFSNLILAIIDEQHRFGVEQRKELIQKNTSHLAPHLLSMTATPIPRTLALTIYGDLDISIINEMPKERKPIITKVVPEEKRVLAYNFIREQIKQGRQAFVVCPLIDISDKLGVKSVKEEFKKLNDYIFKDIEMDMLHGKLKAEEKEKIRKDFLNNKTKILVSTSVIEVGIDVPNATIMLIEGADRFGLSQLHQFRGRVGRSEHQSYCFVFTDSNNEKTLKRLTYLQQHNNGFDLAKKDLELRGEGEIYGTTQKGFPELKMASLFDYKLVKKAQEQAEKIINHDPQLKNYPLLKQKINFWKDIIHLE